MKKILSIALLTGLMLVQNASFALYSNLKVSLLNNKTISAEDKKVGDRVDYVVAYDVKDNSGNVVIKAQTPAQGVVSNVLPMRRIGKSAKITIDNITTKTVDGSVVQLAPISLEPKNRMGRSIALSAIIIPFFLLMHGAKAEFEAGTITTTSVL